MTEQRWQALHTINILSELELFSITLDRTNILDFCWNIVCFGVMLTKLTDLVMESLIVDKTIFTCLQTRVFFFSVSTPGKPEILH